MFQKYEDIDVMISKLDYDSLKQIADELYDVADQLESGVLESKEADVQETVEDAVEEGAVEEASVEVPVQELQDILQLAGYENYAEKIEEYANEPDEEYGDAQEQMVGLSGGLNGPKTHYPAAAGGDNPMAVKALKVTDDVYEGFYSKYDKFVKEFNEENK